MKAAIIYASVHHENTKKVVEAIAGENVVDLIDATKEKERDLRGIAEVSAGSRSLLYRKCRRTGSVPCTGRGVVRADHSGNIFRKNNRAFSKSLRYGRDEHFGLPFKSSRSDRD